MQLDGNIILAYLFGIVLLYLAGWILLVPLKILWRLIYNSIIGALCLIIINAFGGFFGIHIGLNPITAICCGFLGLPGVAFLLFMQYMLRF